MPFHFTIFDVETNGLVPGRCSVLSFSALRVKTWRNAGRRHFQVQEEFDRFYYPLEPYNRQAIRVNGLTEGVIELKRAMAGNDYPLHFIQDIEVPYFCERTELAVCHNTPFDSRFLEQAHGYAFPRSFCTMRNLARYCAIPHSYYGIKWPRLEEAVEIICGRTNFAFHDSLADCYAVLEILKAMGDCNEINGYKKWSEIFDELFS